MFGANNAIMSIVFYIVKLLLAIFLSTFTIYLGLQLFNKITKKVDELEEIKKGNVAVAIVLVSIVLAIASIVQGGIENISLLVNPSLPFNSLLFGMVFAIGQLLVSVAVAVITISIAIYMIGKIAKGLDYETQIKKGNVAVALLVGGILLALSFVIRAGVSAFSFI
ncbi:MAG: DUF350 domain-containing protein [Candidatus Micrarchaeota archaeon]|nr:DUF350 domain-containing protein [Candidatus Micrarchaeota archaeon]